MKNWINKIKTAKEDYGIKGVINELVNTKSLSIFIIAILAIVLFFTFGSNSFTKTEKLSNENGYYQVFNDALVDFPGGELRQTNDDTLQIITSSDETFDLEESPLYYTDLDKFIVTSDMVYVNYDVTEQKRVPKLSEFSLSENGEVSVKVEKEEKNLTDGVLFDGNDTFVFLSDTTLEVDGQSYDLPKFSFVKKFQKEFIIIYDYSKKEAVIIEDYINAKVIDNRFILDLALNKLEYKNGSSLLLFTEPKFLETV